MILYAFENIVYTVIVYCNCRNYRRSPITLVEVKHHVDLCDCSPCTVPVRFVYSKNIPYFHYSSFYGLYVVSQSRNHNHKCRIASFHYVNLGLAYANCLDEYVVHTINIQHFDCGSCRFRQPAQTTTRTHASDKNTRIGIEVSHSNPVPKNCTTCEWTGWVNRYYCYFFILFPEMFYKLVSKSAFTCSGRSCNSNYICFPRVSIQVFQYFYSFGFVIFYHCYKSRPRAFVSF